MSKPEQLSSDRTELWDYIDALLAQNKLLVEALESIQRPSHAPIDVFMKEVRQYVLTARQALSKVKGEG